MDAATRSVTICDRIREDIVAGALSFGRRLTLDFLASRYGVGHMPIREALRQLQGEGLIVLAPNRGARVRVVDATFVRNIFDLRIAIEAMLARRAAECIVPAQLARLEVLEAAYEREAARRDYAALLRLNREFHAVIAEAAQNPEAGEMLDRHKPLVAALWNVHGYGEDRIAGVISDHRHLIAALAARDADVAASLAMAHAAKAKQALLARMAAHAQAAVAA